MTLPLQIQVELVPFGREGFERLISWLPTGDDLTAWFTAITY